MEYVITSTFTKEEVLSIELALQKRIEKLEQFESKAIAAGDVEEESYWNNEIRIAQNASEKILKSLKEIK